MKRQILFSLILLACFLRPLDARASSILLSSKAVSVEAGKTFSFPVVVNPETESLYTAKINLLFPSNLFEVTSFIFDAGWIPLVQPGYDLVDNTHGQLIKTGGFPGGFSSSKTLGTITVRARRAGEGTMAIGSGAFVLNAKSVNTLTSKSSLKIVVKDSTQTTSTQTPQTATVPIENFSTAKTATRPATNAKNLFDVLSTPAQQRSVRSPVIYVLLFVAGLIVAVLVARIFAQIRRRRLLVKLKKKQI